MLNIHLRNAIISVNFMANYSHRKDVISIYIHHLPEAHINGEYYPGREYVKQTSATSFGILVPLKRRQINQQAASLYFYRGQLLSMWEYLGDWIKTYNKPRGSIKHVPSDLFAHVCTIYMYFIVQLQLKWVQKLEKSFDAVLRQASRWESAS